MFANRKTVKFVNWCKAGIRVVWFVNEIAALLLCVSFEVGGSDRYRDGFTAWPCECCDLQRRS